MSAYAFPGLAPDSRPQKKPELISFGDLNQGNHAASAYFNFESVGGNDEKKQADDCDDDDDENVASSTNTVTVSRTHDETCQPTVSYDHDDSMDIVVKDVKIDPVLLIQSLSKSNHKVSSSSSSSSNTKSPKSCRRIRASHSSGGGQNLTPQEQSMQLELEIRTRRNQQVRGMDSTNNNNDEKQSYTIVRSLASILQLRDNLVAERQDGQIGLTRTGTPTSTTTRRRRHMPGTTSTNLDRTCTTIPQVPRLELDGSHHVGTVSPPNTTSTTSTKALVTPPPSSSSRGFSFLQALSRSYVPALETWFQTLTGTVHPKDSLVLWEFLQEDDNDNNHNTPPSPTTSNVTLPTTLGATTILTLRRSESSSSSSLISTTHRNLDAIEESEHEWD